MNADQDRMVTTDRVKPGRKLGLSGSFSDMHESGNKLRPARQPDHSDQAVRPAEVFFMILFETFIS